VNLVVAPPYGSVAQRRKRARDQLVRADQTDHRKDQWTTRDGPRKGPLGGPANGPGVDHLRTTPKTRPEVDPQKIRELAAENLGQRAIAQRLGCSKTTIARVLSRAKAPILAH
jgi:DNA-directed RNA polymerase specialized sigma24 family protein